MTVTHTSRRRRSSRLAAPTARPAGTHDLRLESLTKQFATFTAVNDLDLMVPQGSFFALLGPSGCGKTTTLRMVAGLERPTGGRSCSATRRHRAQALPAPGQHGLPELRAVPAPVDLRERRLRTAPPRAQGRRRRGAQDARAGRAGVAERKKRPTQLSGGQQQRVALARALINKPEVLLLDEPLGALDLKLRRQMQVELKRIQIEVGLTFVHVTHDQEEAMTMADTIAVMNKGVIEQMGAPAELYENPRTTFVANFLGQSNLIAGRDRRPQRRRASSSTCTAPGVAAGRERAASDSGRVWVGVRPGEGHHVGGTVHASADSGGQHRPRWHRVRRQLHRREHAVPGADALGPGAHACSSRTAARSGCSRPAPRSTCTGTRDHAFLLDADQDAQRGRRDGGRLMAVDAPTAAPDPRRSSPPHAVPADDESTGSRGPATCCCCRAPCGWLVLRGAALLAGRDEPVRRPGQRVRRLRDDVELQQLRRRHRQVRRRPDPVVRLRRHRDGLPACCWATRWPTRSRSRRAAGAT